MIEINQLIDKTWLPDNPCLPSSFPELNLEPLKGTNYYYQKLKDAKDKKTKQLIELIKDAIANGNSKVQLPDGTEIDITVHSSWEEFDQLGDAEKSLMKAQCEYALKEIAEQITKSRGTIPGEIMSILDKINTKEPPKFDWKGYLRRFAEGSLNIYTKKLRRKFNKRFEENPGLKIKKRKHILVAVDTSGSVCDDELREFFQEINHIHKTGTDITVIQCDTTITHVEKYKANQEIKIHGRGGTEFQPVIDYYDSHFKTFTCLIYLTDGECSAPEKPKGRMLWVLSSKSNINKELQGPQIKLN